MIQDSGPSVLISRLEQLHKHDHDGGYALADAIVEYSSRMDAEDRSSMQQELLRVVARDERGLGGIALEALVDGWGPPVGPALMVELLARDHSVPLTEMLLMALLRVGHQPVLPMAVRYVQDRSAIEGSWMSPVLAGLCLVDKNAWLQLVSEWLLHATAAYPRNEVAGNVPTLVHDALKTDPALLAALVATLGKRSLATAEMMAECTQEDLGKPWVIERFGESNVSRAARGIEDAIVACRKPGHGSS